MPYPRDADIESLLRALLDGGVELIVVGGVAAILHGAPTTTRDLDIVHRRTPENIERLLAVLGALDASVREPGNRRLRPTASLLAGTGQPLFSTSLGPLDTLCVLDAGRGYDELLADSEEVVDEGYRFLVLSLDALIRAKAAANRPKDQLVLPILIALQRDRTGS